MYAFRGWAELMTDWNGRLFRAGMADPQRQGTWLGRPGATDAQIEHLEARLRAALPPSYRSFLQFSNGWGKPLTHFIDQLWSAAESDWFAARHSDWIEAWAAGVSYYSGSHADDPWENMPEPAYRSEETREKCYVKASHLRRALAISAIGDSAIMLLDPLIVNARGEWEALLFANWIPGAYRYETFWDLMLAEYDGFQQLAESDGDT